MLWGYLKSKVYINKPNTIRSLKEAIKNEMQGVSVAMIDRTIENLQHVRLPAIIQRSGRHFEHLR